MSDEYDKIVYFTDIHGEPNEIKHVRYAQADERGDFLVVIHDDSGYDEEVKDRIKLERVVRICD
jgi:Icc-related predicted phosphoesterase